MQLPRLLASIVIQIFTGPCPGWKIFHELQEPNSVLSYIWSNLIASKEWPGQNFALLHFNSLLHWKPSCTRSTGGVALMLLRQGEPIHNNWIHTPSTLIPSQGSRVTRQQEMCLRLSTKGFPFPSKCHRWALQSVLNAIARVNIDQREGLHIPRLRETAGNLHLLSSLCICS